jgi:Kef-type K+ transport system membrane component KefB
MDTSFPVNLTLGLLMLCGLLFGLFASRFRFPRVAAYVVAGLVLSPDLLGKYINITVDKWTEPLTAGTLGIIAYLIGGSITVQQARRIGKIIFGIALGQSLGAVLFVFIGLLLVLPDTINMPASYLALAFAAISATTAPAGTIAVLHQYRASGPFSSTLLGVVALDDAIGIVLFSIMLVITAGQSLTSSLTAVSLEIGGALILGTVMGRVLTEFGRRIHQAGLRLPAILGAILLVVGLAEAWHLSPLLGAMALGFSARYFLGAAGDRLFVSIEYFEELVFIIFFTVAGAHFEINIFLNHLDLIVIYFFARIIGKIIGAAVAAKAVGAPPQIVKWLGLGLVPQAGVAMGLALTLSHKPAFHETSIIIVNVILAATILYELLSPFILRFGLAQAGEVGEKRERLKR